MIQVLVAVGGGIGLIATALVALLNARRSTSGDIKHTPAEKLWDVLERHVNDLTELVQVLQGEVALVKAELASTTRRLRSTEAKLQEMTAKLAVTTGELADLKRRMADG